MRVSSVSEALEAAKKIPEDIYWVGDTAQPRQPIQVAIESCKQDALRRRRLVYTGSSHCVVYKPTNYGWTFDYTDWKASEELDTFSMMYLSTILEGMKSEGK